MPGFSIILRTSGRSGSISSALPNNIGFRLPFLAIGSFLIVEVALCCLDAELLHFFVRQFEWRPVQRLGPHGFRSDPNSNRWIAVEIFSKYGHLGAANRFRQFDATPHFGYSNAWRRS